MDDESKSKSWMIGGTGLVGGGSLAAFFGIPKYGLWVALIILALGILIFGGYILYRRIRARRQSRNFEGAIEAQTAAAPSAISDPNRRAALDKLRQKFQNGLREFKSRGKDIYKLPWYVIIGESGSGKTEAIRNSGIEFPPGLQDELQGSGGTVNMDWWFTNRSIILDTAGSMIFNESQAGEAPEWKEFLRLLKKSRPQSPVNGLFLVLSIESLIKDSSDKIASKASRLAQQLDMIQRTLDVRFPVYLLVTKCDLLTGFKEFFDNIDDPLLQHQIFGWSNPDPLDSSFRPELVDQHLKTVADRVARRRLALLRDGAAGNRVGETQFFVSPYQQTGATTKRRLDEVDAFFALPESIMRLAPRLRRYLETVFVAGEWSAKPVFLRGIYFTSSMREGRALDEAMAMATGLSLEQLPEDRRWERNRSFFMRDLFLEKVFREHGLVTRASNTINLLRKRRILLMGCATTAMLVVLLFCYLSYRSLRQSIGAELSMWQTGTSNWNHGEWGSSIVRPGADEPFHFSYAGETPVAGNGSKSIVAYQSGLQQQVQNPLQVGLLFKPMAWLSSGKDMKRLEAEQALFEGGVLKPLMFRVREKMERQPLPANNPVSASRHRDALISLMQLEADRLAGGGSMATEKSGEAAAKYIGTFVSYLTDTNYAPDTNLVEVLRWNYSSSGARARAAWPPVSIMIPRGDEALSNNPAIMRGLVVFREANRSTQKNIENEAKLLGDFADQLSDYHAIETAWLAAAKANSAEDVSEGGPLYEAKRRVDDATRILKQTDGLVAPVYTNFTDHYALLERAAMEASSGTFKDIASGVPDQSKTKGIFADIKEQLNSFAREAGNGVHTGFIQRSKMIATLDRDQLALSKNGAIVFEQRWNLYSGAAALANETIQMTDSVIGNEWKRFSDLKSKADQFDLQLAAYNGPYSALVNTNCQLISGAAIGRVKGRFLDEYVGRVSDKVVALGDLSSWSARNAADSKELLDRISRDLKAATERLNDSERKKLAKLGDALLGSVANLQSKIGFPISMSSAATSSMGTADLAACKRILTPLVQTLKDSAWLALMDDAAQGRAAALAKTCQRFQSVADMLINTDGSPAGFEVFFVPPKNPSPDFDIIKVYRQANFQIGDGVLPWSELPAMVGEGRKSIGKGTLINPIKLSFRRLSTDAPETFLNLPEWAVIRMIREGQAQVSEAGADCQFSIKLTDGQYSGVATFLIVPERPFPAKNEWLMK